MGLFGWIFPVVVVATLVVTLGLAASRVVLVGRHGWGLVVACGVGMPALIGVGRGLARCARAARRLTPSATSADRGPYLRGTGS
jgi:hypothetical protein